MSRSRNGRRKGVARYRHQHRPIRRAEVEPFSATVRTWLDMGDHDVAASMTGDVEPSPETKAAVEQLARAALAHIRKSRED